MICQTKFLLPFLYWLFLSINYNMFVRVTEKPEIYFKTEVSNLQYIFLTKFEG